LDFTNIWATAVRGHHSALRANAITCSTTCSSITSQALMILDHFAQEHPDCWAPRSSAPGSRSSPPRSPLMLRVSVALGTSRDASVVLRATRSAL
jgi:hypothetical protein